MRGYGSLTQLSDQIIPGHEAEKDTTIKSFDVANPELWVYLPLLLKGRPGRAQLQCMLVVDRGLVEG